MDISSAIVNIYKIENVSLRDYEEMLTSGKSSKYRIKLDTRKNGLLVQDLKNPKNMIMIKCIKEYYSPTTDKQTFVYDNCTEIQERILGHSQERCCQECHKNCISKFNSQELYKINI